MFPQPEFAHVHEVLVGKTNIVVASPKGGKAPLDPQSVEMYGKDPYCATFLEKYQELWHNTITLSDAYKRVNDFDAIYYVGGHGREYPAYLPFFPPHHTSHPSSRNNTPSNIFPAMWDLVTDSYSIALLTHLSTHNRLVSTICHGTAALLNVVLPDNTPLVSGHEVTGYANAEEDFIGQTAAMPFLLETELIKKGGKFVKAKENFGSKVAVARGGRLITGQNPGSAHEFGKVLAKELGVDSFA
jgi:putative intracellular protease/amidase